MSEDRSSTQATGGSGDLLVSTEVNGSSAQATRGSGDFLVTLRTDGSNAQATGGSESSLAITVDWSNCEAADGRGSLLATTGEGVSSLLATRWSDEFLRACTEGGRKCFVRQININPDGGSRTSLVLNCDRRRTRHRSPCCCLRFVSRHGLYQIWIRRYSGLCIKCAGWCLGRRGWRCTHLSFFLDVSLDFHSGREQLRESRWVRCANILSQTRANLV